jgi:hypothetical protein
VAIHITFPRGPSPIKVNWNIVDTTLSEQTMNIKIITQKSTNEWKRVQHQYRHKMQLRCSKPSTCNQAEVINIAFIAFPYSISNHYQMQRESKIS